MTPIGVRRARILVPAPRETRASRADPSSSPTMKRVTLAVAALGLLAVTALPACHADAPTQRYGFLTRLGDDTIAVESVSRSANTVTSDAVDRFPRVRRRHTVIQLAADGSIRHLVMDIHTPSAPPDERDRRVIATVTKDSVHVTKQDRTGTLVRSFATNGGMAMAHVPQSYTLYELYFDAALRRAAAAKRTVGDTVQMRQFYIDREFDKFPLHRGVVRLTANDHAEITHDWLAGTGEATFDSAHRMLHYSGARTTYKVEVTRLTTPPDIAPIADRFAATEAMSGVRQLSVRDTVRATIGAATLTVDYARPLARGRVLLGDVVPYDHVWRTGANAATQFTTSRPITLAGLIVPAGSYTLWTIPHPNSVELIVNRQTGQWGTQYGPGYDLGRAPMTIDSLATPVEQFTIAIDSTAAQRGALTMSWGSFHWTAPIQVR